MKKRVNVHATVPVTTLKYPIAGSVRNVMMDVADIRLCLCGKAKVEEILPSGKTVRLGFNNYDNTVPTDSRVTNQPVQPHVPVEAAKAKVEEEAKAAEEAKAEEAKVEEVVAEEEKKEEVPDGGRRNKKRR